MALARPTVVAFDVMGTLFDLRPLARRLSAVGLPEHALFLWYARTLRDGMALDAAGVFKSFKEVATSTLAVLMVESGRTTAASDAEDVLGGLAQLPAYGDVAPALTWLREKARVVLLTNGSADNTRQLVKHSGLEHLVERIVSIEEVEHWKPRAEVYLHAAKVCGVEPGEMALVASHAWDTQGASRVGFRTGWVARTEPQFSAVMEAADVTGTNLTEVIEGLFRRVRA